MEEIPKELDELCDYILKHADDIYVREQIDEKWGAYSLSEIPTKLALKWVMKWIKCSYFPIHFHQEDLEDLNNGVDNESIPELEGMHRTDMENYPNNDIIKEKMEKGLGNLILDVVYKKINRISKR